MVCVPSVTLDVVTLAIPFTSVIGPASAVDPSWNVTAPSVTTPPAPVVTVAVNVTAWPDSGGLGAAETTVIVGLTTVTTAVAWLVAPLGSVTVRRTVVRPIAYGPAGDCVIVSGSPSASDEPSLTDASAVPDAPASTVTSFVAATGTWFGEQVARHAPATVNVYGVPAPSPASSSCTSTTKVCAPPGRLNE